MKRFGWLPLLAVFAASRAHAQPAIDSVRRMDSVWARAYAMADTNTLQRLFASAMVVTTSGGSARTRSEEIADNAPNPAVTVHSFVTRNVAINLYGADAVLAGEAQWDVTATGQRRVIARRYSASYARGGSFGWQMAALHFFPPALSPTAPPPSDGGVAGRWEGALGATGNGLRLVVDVSRAADGLLSATLRSVDQGGGPLPVARTTQTGDSVHLEIPVIGGRYDAVLSADKTRLIGTFNQGQPVPLTLTRTAAPSAPIATPAPASPLGLGVDVNVPIRPMVFRAGGKRHLIYELHIVNHAGGELLLTRIEAIANDGRTLAAYEGATLGSILEQARLGVTDARALPAGVRAVAFIQVTLDSGAAVPTTIRHRIIGSNQRIETAAMGVDQARPITIGAPFTGDNWRAANGPGNTSGHRRALIPIAAHAVIAQRFATDWLQENDAGSTFSGNRADNKSYFAYGKEIVAVADGVISVTKDSIPENVPGATSRAVPITLETIAGNHVIQDLGGGRYALYAHLQPGSLRVKPGQRVRRGQVIGLLGNSGNSTEPHLHFHIMNSPSPLGAEGLPYHIDSWEIRTPDRAWERRMNELPMQGARIRISPAPRPK